MQFKKIKILILIFILILSKQAIAIELLNQTVAEVNDNVITQIDVKIFSQLYKIFMSKQDIPTNSISFNKQILNQLILNKIQIQLAKEKGVYLDTDILREVIREYTKKLGIDSLTKLQEQFANIYISSEILNDFIKTEIIISELQQKSLLPNINVSDIEIQHFIKSPIGQQYLGTKFRLGHILMFVPEDATQGTIKKIKQKSKSIMHALRQGESFANLVKLASEDHHALRGCDLGWREIDQIPTLFLPHVNHMKIGEIKGPLKSTSGLHIVKLLDRQSKIKQDAPVEFQIQHILISNQSMKDKEAKEKLLAIRQKTLKYGKFKELSEQFSERITWIEKADVDINFFKKLEKLNVGEISEPFRTPSGWHIIKLQDKRQQGATLNSVYMQVKRWLQKQKFAEERERWVLQLRDNAYIKILDPTFQS